MAHSDGDLLHAGGCDFQDGLITIQLCGWLPLPVAAPVQLLLYVDDVHFGARLAADLGNVCAALSENVADQPFLDQDLCLVHVVGLRPEERFVGWCLLRHDVLVQHLHRSLQRLWGPIDVEESELLIASQIAALIRQPDPAVGLLHRPDGGTLRPNDEPADRSRHKERQNGILREGRQTAGRA